MPTSMTITLPSGLWVDGVHHRQASLRALTGEDESFITETRELWRPAECVTAILGRCLTRLGNLDVTNKNSQELARRLTVGDREALMLHLRRLTLGDNLAGVLSCPNPGCSTPVDLALRVADLLLPPYPQPQPEYRAVVQENGLTWQIRFRLPTGQDQEDASQMTGSQINESASLLLKRCLLAIVAGESEGTSVSLDGELPAAIVAALPDLLIERDPQAEVQLELSCPTCGHKFSALLDTAGYFFREITRRSSYLYQQIHTLALYYHWSETDIMSMPTERRLRYLNLLEEAFGEGTKHD
jgi:hypothetical protein